MHVVARCHRPTRIVNACMHALSVVMSRVGRARVAANHDQASCPRQPLQPAGGRCTNWVCQQRGEYHLAQRQEPWLFGPCLPSTMCLLHGGLWCNVMGDLGSPFISYIIIIIIITCPSPT